MKINKSTADFCDCPLIDDQLCHHIVKVVWIHSAFYNNKTEDKTVKKPVFERSKQPKEVARALDDDNYPSVRLLMIKVK